MVLLMFITLWKIFTYVCGVGAWGQNKRYSGRKNERKVKEAVESGACEGWENTLETASVLRPPNPSHGVKYVPRPGVKKPKEALGGAGVAAGAAAVPCQQGESRDQWQQACATAPGPLQWPPW